jgi:hypothetical protein
MVRGPGGFYIGILSISSGVVLAQTDPLVLAARHAGEFQGKAPHAPHPFIAVGAAAQIPLGARFFHFDVVSEYKKPEPTAKK